MAELLECGWFTESPRIFFEALPLSDGHVKLHVDGQLLEGPQEHFRNLARALLNPQEFHRTLPFAVHRLSALGGGGVMLDIQGFRTDLSGQEAQELGEGLQSIVSGLPQRPGIYLASGQLVPDDSEDIEYHIGAFDTIEQAKATCTRHAREQFGQVSGEPEDTPVDQDSQLDLDFAASEHTSNVWTADDGGHLHYTIAYFELNARYA
ncbi:MAG: hypothetical protein Q4C67_11260 [Deinococcus sp.]|nr:hypothetical protein [Deinococcus sp.]